jgi:hypothetical protein
MYHISKHQCKCIFNYLAELKKFKVFIPALLCICILFSSDVSFSQVIQAADSTQFNNSDSTVQNFDDSLPSSKDAFKTDVTYSSKDSIYFDAQNKIVHLWGDAKMHYDKIDLQAAYIWIDFKSNTLHAVPMVDSFEGVMGKPIFKDGDKEFHVDSMSYNFKSKRGKISGFVTKEGDGIIYCADVKKDSADNLYGAHARYSTCIDTLHPHFYINATKLKIIPKKQIITGPANLVVGDVPTPAFVPFGFFPISQGQKKGFLFPTYGESPGIGFFFRNLGYYIPINRHIDLKLLTDIYTNTSWGATVSSSYNYIYKFKGNFSFLYNTIKKGDPDVPTEYTKSKLFKVNWAHTVDPKARPGTTFNLSINAQSSGYNTNVPTASYQDLTNNQFNSSINYGYTFGEGKYNITAAMRHSQNTQTHDVSLSLPDVNFSINSFAPLARKQMVGTSKWYENIRIGYNMHMLNKVDVKDENLFKPQVFDSIKNGIIHQIPLQLPTLKILKYATLSPQFRYQEYWYTQTYEKTWYQSQNKFKESYNNEMRRAYDWNTSASLTTRIFGFFNINKWNLVTIRHTATPSINFTYQPDFASPQYHFYRYERPDSILKYTGKYSSFTNSVIGGPSAGKQGTINFSLNNNFELKYKEKKDSVVKTQKMSLIDNLSFNTSYNFLADSFKLSNLGISGFIKLFKNLNINFNGSVDPYKYINGVKKDIYDLQFSKGKLGRLAVGNIALNTQFNSDMFKKNKEEKSSSFGTEAERKMVQENPDDYIDFNMPWNLSLNYTFNYSNYYTNGLPLKTYTQYITFTGSVSLTTKWKVSISSGYDIHQKALTATTIDLYRDLHCWEMSFNWIPIGPFQRYMFTLKAKSALLQDLKLNKRRDAWDR